MRSPASQLSLDYEGVNRYWRPLVVMAQVFERSKSTGRPKVAAVRCKKRSKRLRGVQLGLFEDFYRPLAPVTPVRNFAQPLIDVFPEAYPE